MVRRLLPNVPGAELRPLAPSHAEALFALIDANRAYLRRWLPCVAEMRTRADVDEFIADARAVGAPEDGLALGVWYRGELAGMVGFNAIDPIDRMAEIGYWLGAAYQGRGIMTNAVRALVTYAFDALRLRRAVILCAVANTRSAAVARRLGFQSAGIIREAEWLDDGCVDDEIFVMHAAAWDDAPMPLAAAYA